MHDLRGTLTTTLVNRASGPDGAVGPIGARYAADHSISADGHLVAFSSDAPNLTTDNTNSANEVYLRDLSAQTTTLISRGSGPDGAPANGRSYGGLLTADGGLMFVLSESTNLTADGQNGAFVRELSPSG